MAVSRQALAAHEAEESPVSGCGGPWVPFCHKEGRIGGPSMNRGNQRFNSGGWRSTDDGWRLAGRCTRCRGGGGPEGRKKNKKGPHKTRGNALCTVPNKEHHAGPQGPPCGQHFFSRRHTHTYRPMMVPSSGLCSRSLDSGSAHVSSTHLHCVSTSCSYNTQAVQTGERWPRRRSKTGVNLQDQHNSFHSPYHILYTSLVAPPPPFCRCTHFVCTRQPPAPLWSAM